MIGIDASRAFLPKRTGIEEYSYQVIKHLTHELAEERVVLYVRGELGIKNKEVGNAKSETRQMQSIRGIDFELPENWEVKELWGPRVWTQGRLALEMLFRPVDALFVPAHTVPWIHPERTVVVIHGLEYEFCPEAYSRWERWYMRWSIKNSCRWASKIIAVSENTKRDLVRLYGVPEGKVRVIYEGIGYQELGIKNKELGDGSKFQSASWRTKVESDFKEQVRQLAEMSREQEEVQLPTSNPPAGGQLPSFNPSLPTPNSQLPTPRPYFLFIGRVETRKNVGRMIEAFDIFKKKCGTEHKLVLAGKPGYGYEGIKNQELRIKYAEDIVELGYVSEEKKWELLENAEGFLFPSLYEGFGLPVLEAQAVGVPVLTSNTSSLPEISGMNSVILQDGGLQPRTHVSVNDKVCRNKKSMLQTCSCRKDGAILVDPLSVEDIALGIERLALDRGFRGAIIEGGLQNVKRFSWEQCAREIAEILYDKKSGNTEIRKSGARA